MPKTYDVFISHKSEHKPWVIWLAEALQSCGYSVFLDIWSLIPGDSWVEGLHQGLSQCRAAVLVATPEVVNSGWVRLEHARLMRRRQSESEFRFIPIVFGDFPNLPFLDDVQGVDFRDPMHYREAFHRLLCGLRGEEPGHDAKLPCEIPLPPPMKNPDTTAMVPGEARFLERLVVRMMRPVAPPMMILSRGRRYQGPVIQALLERVKDNTNNAGLLHLMPPYSEQVDQEAYFLELGRQCNFTASTDNSIAFTAAIEQKIKQDASLFILVSSFENANEACRRELAGILRGLTEKHPTSLRIALFGGQRLLEQKYGRGELSFLSHAELEEWPDPDVADVMAWQQQEFPKMTLDSENTQALLMASGGHAGQVRGCLERFDGAGGNASWAEWCYACPEVWETWVRLAAEMGDELRASIARYKFGPVLPWPPNALARRLYWADLLKAQGGQLGWRSDIIRQVGQEVLE